MWKASRFLMSRLYGGHVSAPHRREEAHTASYTETSVPTFRVLFSDTLLRRRPQAEEALLMQLVVSVSREQCEETDIGEVTHYFERSTTDLEAQVKEVGL